MARVVCPSCHAAIPAADVNVGEGVAFCRACEELTDLADILRDTIDADVDAPPSGCSREAFGGEVRLVASRRSLLTAAMALAFAGFWNSIVLVFVLVALAATIRHVFGDVPDWFPGPGPEMNDEPMSIGMTLFFWIFLTPFIVIGTGMAGWAIISLFGRTEVRMRGGQGRAFTGVGPFRWTRRFDPGRVEAVRIGETGWMTQTPSGVRHGQRIELDVGGRTVRFGAGLRNDRREWLAAALREHLIDRQ